MLEIHTFGGLNVQKDGKPLPKLVSKAAEGLLVYLAVTRKSYPRDVLAEMFWPERPAGRSQSNLRTVLSSLRKHAGDYVDAEREQVAINSHASVWVDALDFEEHLENGRSAEAIELFSGEFLAGFNVRGSYEFEEWQAGWRERLRQNALGTYLAFAEEALAQGSYREGQQYVRRALEIDPLDENAHRCLMHLLAMEGRRTAALEQFESCRALLEKELSVAPAEETVQLYEKIRAGEVHSGAQPRHNLPLRAVSLIGRDTETAALTAKLRDSESALLTLVGPGGVGKTSLAIQTALQCLPDFDDGVFLISLAPMTDPQAVTLAIAEAVNVSLEGSGSREDQLLAYLQNKHTLLVLDNFEHLLPATMLLPGLIAGCPKLSLLITSRERLGLPQEHLFELDTLAFPFEDATLDKASYPSMQLFVQRARMAKSDFDFSDGEIQSVAKICRLVGGLPLALELAASWVRILSIGEIAGEIEKGLAILHTAAETIPARHRSVQAVFDHSWKLLSSKEQEAFARLSIFRGGFLRKAAEAVANARLPLLSSLADKSLIRRDEHGRYQLHELLRQYAADKLDQLAIEEDTFSKHFNYFLEFVENAADFLQAEDAPQWLSLLDDEHDNIRAALDWVANRPELAIPALKFVFSMHQFWKLRGHNTEGRRRIDLALSLATPKYADSMLFAQVLRASAHLAYLQTALDACRDYYERCLPIFRRLGEREAVAGVLGGLGNAATETGDYDLSLEYFRESRALWSEVNNLNGLAESNVDLGWAYMRSGDFETAQKYLKEALQLYREIGNPEGLGFALSGLGESALRKGALEAAVAYLEESLAVRKKLGHKWGVAASLGSLAWVAILQGDHETANEHLLKSMSLRAEFNDIGGMAWCLEKLAEVSKLEDKLERAASLFGASAALRETIGSVIDPVDQPAYEELVAVLKNALGEQNFDQAWQRGALMSEEKLADYAVA